MSVAADLSIPPLPDGLVYDDDGLRAYGVIARDIPNHLVLPRSGRRFSTCMFDHLGGQTMSAMHLARIEPGGVKCDHRHLDETIAFVVSGAGYSEFRQADDADLIRVDWSAGDLIVIPTNAYHKHTNVVEDGFTRQLSFRNTRIMNSLVHGSKTMYDNKRGVYNQGARFFNRFADEPDYFSRRTETGPNRVDANYVRAIADEPLPPDDPRLGQGVAIQHYRMGAQLMLEVALVGVRAGGAIRPHRPNAEESFIVLKGTGVTELWNEGGEFLSISWGPGDLVAPPLGVWRQHRADQQDVRLLRVRNGALQRSLGIVVESDLDTSTPPDRFPRLVEPDIGPDLATFDTPLWKGDTAS